MGALTFLTRAALCVCFAFPLTSTAKNKPKTSVADLRYGVALYHHYNEDDLLAMSELMKAKAQDGIKGHGDNPDIMEGGFALAYGMDDYAEEIFNRVLEQNRPQDVRDAAWFYLARMRYDKNDWEAADNAAQKISSKPPKYLKNELISLRMSSAIRQGNLDAAQNMEASKKVKQGWKPYLQFNLASAYARQGQYDEALALYQYFDDETFKREEHLSLYDKAMTASGYSYLFSDRAELAAIQFSKVRLDSPLSSRALLGYGWAKAELELYEDALVSWHHLSKKTLVDENAQESLVAIPYAYEKLGRPSLALKEFKQAESRFVAALAEIDDIMINLSDDTMLEVLKIKRSEELDWIVYAEKNQLSPQLSYLIRLFSLEEFHKIVHELRDLLAIKQGYEQWQNKIAFYDSMLFEREKNRAQQTQQLLSESLLNQINNLKRRRDQLTQQYDRIKEKKDYFSLATQEEQDLIQRVTKAAVRIEQLRETDPFIDESEEAIRRYKGILLWDTSQHFVPRLWELQKKIQVIDATLKEMRNRFSAINIIINSAPDLSPHRKRFDQNKNKITVQLAKIESHLTIKKRHLRSKIYEVLEAQRFNVKQYIAQSRLSIARILDEKSKKEEGNTSINANKLTELEANIDEAPPEAKKAEGGAL